MIKKTYGFWTWQVFGFIFIQHFVRNIIRKVRAVSRITACRNALFSCSFRRSQKARCWSALAPFSASYKRGRFVSVNDILRLLFVLSCMFLNIQGFGPSRVTKAWFSFLFYIWQRVPHSPSPPESPMINLGLGQKQSASCSVLFSYCCVERNSAVILCSMDIVCDAVLYRGIGNSSLQFCPRSLMSMLPIFAAVRRYPKKLK